MRGNVCKDTLFAVCEDILFAVRKGFLVCNVRGFFFGCVLVQCAGFILFSEWDCILCLQCILFCKMSNMWLN